MLRAILVLAGVLACFSLAALAQPMSTAGDKKPDTAKSKDAPKNKIPLDQAKLPKNAVVVVVDNLLEAMALFPKSAVIPFEKYQEMLNEIDSLKRQLKADKRPPSSCKLHGKLVGNVLEFRAEFTFSTEQPKTTVFLGLLGGVLLPDGELDGQAANLDLTEDGFTIRVAKEGDHQLALNFGVPVAVKKSATGTLERGFELGLPGAAVTFLDLELPASVKELLWNKTLEKTKTPGRWKIGLEKSKTLSLAWKEPLPLSGNAPPKVEIKVKVDIDATHVNIAADLFLEDRSQTKEWHLRLPALAKMVEVKAPPGLKYEWITPDDKTPYHILRISDPTAEPWQVSLSLRVPRPNPGARVAIGPFYVLGAFEQLGTINVKMPAEVAFGQRLVYVRSEQIYSFKNTEAEADFKYSAAAVSDKNIKGMLALKAPLELEWRYDKNQVKTQVEHALKMKTVNQGWEIEATTRIHVEALFGAVNAVELKLPLPRPRGVSLIGTVSPAVPFPGGLPWTGVWKTFGMPWSNANPDDFTVMDEAGNPLKVAPQDTTGKMRVFWDRGPTKQMTLVLKNSFRIPPQNHRIRIELPRPINTQDRGAKLSIQTDDRIELLHGPADEEEPVPDGQHFDLSWDQTPAHVDVAWQASHREIVAHSTIDITLHEHTAQVRQSIRFPRDRSPAAGPESKTAQIQLLVPPEASNVSVVSGGVILNPNPVKESLWLRPGADGADPVEIVLQYDLAMTNKLTVASIWPASVSQKNAKVRVWSPAGMKARLTEDLLERGLWKERSIEAVPDKEQFPSLVLQGYGAHLPLTLKVEATAAAALAAFQADRALIQVQVNDDGSQQCRARYFVRKIHAPHLDVELPLPLNRLRSPPTFSLGTRPLEHWEVDNAVRVKLHPDLIPLPAVLEITYTLPPDERVSSWKTSLHAPIFRTDAVIGQMRWQLSLPKPALAVSLGRNVHAETQWGLQGYLPTPEPAFTSGDLETWLTGKEAAQPGSAVTFAFSHIGMAPETVYYLDRRGWLLACSGLFLIVTLGGYYSPLPRRGFWMILVLLGAGMLTLALLCPAAVAPLLFGLQPGLLLFVVFVASHQLWQERYRRQLVFMPGFTRTKPHSTMVRSNSAKRPRDESTIDAPGAAPPAPKPSGSQAGS